jgi:hypothetical protein
VSLLPARVRTFSILVIGVPALLAASSLGQTSEPVENAGQSQLSAPQPVTQIRFEMPKSSNPLHAYAPDTVPEPVLTNSSRLNQEIRDGKLYLSLKDAIELALEDNLDLAIARYNLPIANTDILRTQAGGFFRFRYGCAWRRCGWYDRRCRRSGSRGVRPGAVDSRRRNSRFFL